VLGNRRGLMSGLRILCEDRCPIAMCSRVAPPSGVIKQTKVCTDATTSSDTVIKAACEGALVPACDLPLRRQTIIQRGEGERPPIKAASFVRVQVQQQPTGIKERWLSGWRRVLLGKDETSEVGPDAADRQPQISFQASGSAPL